MGRVIGKGRRNGLRLHTERQVMELSYRGYREGKMGKGRTKKEIGRHYKIARLKCTGCKCARHVSTTQIDG
jgi:hypothetical protein